MIVVLRRLIDISDILWNDFFGENYRDTWELARRSVVSRPEDLQINPREFIDSFINRLNRLNYYNSYTLRGIKDWCSDLHKINKGQAILLFLLDWNAINYRNCNIQKMNLETYANYLDNKISELYREYENTFNEKNILDLPNIRENTKDFLEKLHQILKHKESRRDREHVREENEERNRECFKTDCSKCESNLVATYKVASILFPKIFIPIDNPISQFLGYAPLDVNHREYLNFLEKIGEIFRNKNITNIEEKTLKKLDQLLFLFISKYHHVIENDTINIHLFENFNNDLEIIRKYFCLLFSRKEVSYCKIMRILESLSLKESVIVEFQCNKIIIRKGKNNRLHISIFKIDNNNDINIRISVDEYTHSLQTKRWRCGREFFREVESPSDYSFDLFLKYLEKYILD
ncbi:hypothetical protein [Aquifex sp.]